MGEKDKIKKYLEYKGISKNKFYTETGLSVGFLDSGKSLGADKVKIIINTYPDLNLDWLIMDTGPMISSPEPVEIETTFKQKADHTLSSQNVPLFRITAQAGIVALFNDKNSAIPISHLQIPDLPPCDGALYVYGDSMYPLLKSGDIVLYKEVSIENILWGEMYLVAFSRDGDDFVAIKYIQKAEQKENVTLVSQNAYHAPCTIPRDSIRALALIKASVRFNTMG